MTHFQLEKLIKGNGIDCLKCVLKIEKIMKGERVGGWLNKDLKEEIEKLKEQLDRYPEGAAGYTNEEFEELIERETNHQKAIDYLNDEAEHYKREFLKFKEKFLILEESAKKHLGAGFNDYKQ